MAIRITPNLADTNDIVAKVLVEVLADKRVSFLVPAGQADNILARVRVMISRRRQKVMNAGKKPKRFQLNSTVHPETHGGKRLDCIILWKHQDDIHMMTEFLEDILSNG